MKQIKTEDLIEHQALPYNLYNDTGEKIFEAGKILTPQKLAQLKYFSAIYIDENESTDDYITTAAPPKLKDRDDQRISEKEYWENFFKEDYSVNSTSVIPVQEQLGIKKTYQQAMSSFVMNESTSQETFSEARDKVIEVILPAVDTVKYRSQLQILGDYFQTHSINVSILAIMLGSKLKLKETAINDLALAAMFHDIGKTKIDKNILLKSNLTPKEQQVIHLHPQIGYKILKNDFGFNDSVCRAVLEHHENHDGSGYPYGISDNQISLFGQIIHICSYYDNLISGKIRNGIKTSKDALKIILEVGPSHFSSKILYTFINMSSYNDTTPFKDMEQ